jgi:hypothetical protein
MKFSEIFLLAAKQNAKRPASKRATCEAIARVVLGRKYTDSKTRHVPAVIYYQNFMAPQEHKGFSAYELHREYYSGTQFQPYWCHLKIWEKRAVTKHRALSLLFAYEIAKSEGL